MTLPPWPEGVGTPEPAGLTRDDALSLWIGRVARSSATLDMTLRDYAMALLPDGPHDARGAALLGGERWKLLENFGQLRDYVASLLDTADPDDDLTKRGRRLLHHAKAAHAQRNRYVHDPALMVAPPEGTDDDPSWIAWRLGDPSAPLRPITTDSLRDLELDFRTLAWTATMLGSAVGIRQVGPALDYATGPGSFVAQIFALFDARFPDDGGDLDPA